MSKKENKQKRKSIPGAILPEGSTFHLNYGEAQKRSETTGIAKWWVKIENWLKKG